MTVVNDQSGFAHLHYNSRSFVEFLELLARVAELRRNVKKEKLAEGLKKLVDALMLKF